MLAWKPPENWMVITTLDVHAGSEPLRIITGGYPGIPGKSILEKRRYLKEHLDHLRQVLMREPRGHKEDLFFYERLYGIRW